MIQIARTAIQHPLISGSGIIIVGSIAGNLFNFLFNLFMSRNLPVSDYGTFVSIMSLIILATIPLSSVAPVIVNFAGTYFAKNEFGMVNLFYRKTIRYLIFASFLILILIFLFSGDIAYFFHIKSNGLISLAGIVVAIIYLGTLNGGLLQAKLSFKFISLSNFISAFLKLTVGVGLVLLGYGIFGAIGAVLLSFLVPFLISFIPLAFIFEESSHDKYKLPMKEIFTYGIPSTIAIFGLNALVSVDLLLVKRLFSPELAGLYAGMSLVGKVIFYLTAPIGSVMYPLIIQKHAKNENYKNTLYIAILIVFIPSLLVSIFYFAFPEFVIAFFLKNTQYLLVSSNLGFFGLFIAVYSAISLLTYYFLSIKKTSIWLPISIASLAQFVLILVFHESFSQIILISLIVSVLLLSSLLLYFRKTD